MISESPDDTAKSLEKKYQKIFEQKRVAYNQEKMDEKRLHSINSLRTVENEIKMLN